MSDHYYNFPLAVLHGIKKETTPLQCMELAMRCGMYNAGVGLLNNDSDEFAERLEDIINNADIEQDIHYGDDQSCVLVGANVCNADLGSKSRGYLETIADQARQIPNGGALVRMSSEFLWAAIDQARAENDPNEKWPDRGISWREFRVLCAILSVKRNRHGFAFIGWETIQYRCCGFTNRAGYKSASRIPCHLQPPLTRKQIRRTCDDLENLGFYARFRMSKGKVGGLMAYSFRHTREELAAAVCEHVNFRDQKKLREYRREDAAKCLELLERAKMGPRAGQDGGQD